MKKIFFLLSILIATISQAQVTVVGYISTQGVANYPTHIDSMGKGGYMVTRDTNQRNTIPCLRRKFGMMVYAQAQERMYILKDSACNNVWEAFSGGGGGGSQDLQSVLSNGHGLTNEQNYQGSNAGDANTGINVNAFGGNAGKSNSGNNLNALGNNAGAGNTGLSVNALGNSAAFNNTGDYVNAFGQDTVAGYNTGIYVNAIGSGALYKNSGNHVNALGGGAGANNTHSNVNLFGLNATASEDGQVVFTNTNIYKSRISYACAEEDRDYRLPNKSGYFMTADFPITIDGNISSTYTITYPDNYQVINVSGEDSVTLFFPDPTISCLNAGQRLVITNIVNTDKPDEMSRVIIDQTYPVYYRGTDIPITILSDGATAEFYSDGSVWRSISSLPEPVVNLDLSASGYYIHSNGTYNIIIPSSGANKLYFPPACNMEGGHITIINRDATNSQNLDKGTVPSYCPNQDIVKADGTSVSSANPESTSTYIAVNGQWVQIFERH